MGIYLKSKTSKQIDNDRALNYIESLLRKAYRNRTVRRPTFDRTKKSSIKIKFEDHPKINLDIVCIESKEHTSIDNWGEILRRDDSRRETSISEHIAFVTERNKQFENTPFNQIVMLWKWWRNHKFTEFEQDKFNSFFLETYLGKAFDSVCNSFGKNWIDNMIKLGQWILRHRFEEIVWFKDERISDPEKWPDDPIVVLDPINKSNNITHDWNIHNKEHFLTAVTEFCEILTDARLAYEAEDIDEELNLLDSMLPHFSEWSE